MIFLGCENEYEQKVLPGDGKLSVDGFICVFDVSNCPNRTVETQIEAVSQILSACQKSKKPILIVTTKNDDRNENLVKSIEKLVAKSFKSSIPIVESSALFSINVDETFLQLANLILGKSPKNRTILSYFEAFKRRQEILEVADLAFRQKLKFSVVDHRIKFSEFQKKFANFDADFLHFIDLFGISKAQQIFLNHQRDLRQIFSAQTMRQHLARLPEIFDHLLPEFSMIEGKNWDFFRAILPNFPHFSEYFQPPGSLERSLDVWPASPMSPRGGDDPRAPPEILDMPEAEIYFKNHCVHLENQAKRKKLHEEFLNLLRNSPQVTPGKPLDDVRIFLMTKEAFETMPQNEIQSVYDRYQKSLVRHAKRDFVELLLENVEEFVSRVLFGAKSRGIIPPLGGLSETELKEIHEKLQEDIR